MIARDCMGKRSTIPLVHVLSNFRRLMTRLKYSNQIITQLRSISNTLTIPFLFIRITTKHDTRLPFRAKSSPEIFHPITQAVCPTMAERGYHGIVVFLDDFLVIGEARAECERAFSVLLEVLQDLGFTIRQHKLVPPTQRLVFLSVQLYTVPCTMTLPAEKLADLSTVISSFQRKRRATKASCNGWRTNSIGLVEWFMADAPFSVQP